MAKSNIRHVADWHAFKQPKVSNVNTQFLQSASLSARQHAKADKVHWQAHDNTDRNLWL